MSALNDVMEIAKKLSINDRNKLVAILKWDVFDNEIDVDEFLIKERFANGRVCPYCGLAAVSKNWHQKDGTQRYICKDCRKSFVATTNSIASGTGKNLSTWEKYVKAKPLLWQDLHVSVVGNLQKRGLSKEKVCVPCAVNRNGLSVAKIGNLGRVAAKDLHFVFDNHIRSGATMCTDDMNSYCSFASESGLKLVQTKGKESRRGDHNIQHINNYHSQLKDFLEPFNGVSSKYLNNYLIWHNFANYAKNALDEKQEILLRFAFVTPKKITNKQLSNRNPHFLWLVNLQFGGFKNERF